MKSAAVVHWYLRIDCVQTSIRALGTQGGFETRPLHLRMSCGDVIRGTDDERADRATLQPSQTPVKIVHCSSGTTHAHAEGDHRAATCPPGRRLQRSVRDP